MQKWLGLFIMGIASVAQAYILPAEVIVKNYVEYKTDATLQDVCFVLNNESNGEKQLCFKRGNHFYLKTSEAVVVKNGIDKDEGPVEQFLSTLWFIENTPNKTESFLKNLRAYGIDTRVVSLGYLNKQVVYILGAQAFETNKPLVAFTKDNFVPVRYVLSGTFKQKTGLFDIRLFYDTNTKFPDRIEFFTEKTFIERDTVSKLQKNQNLSEALFILPKS